jgi:methyl coenzyme M reductase subunit D
MMLLQTRLLYLKYSDSKQTTTENLGMYTVHNKRVCKSIIGCQYQVSTATFPRQTVTKSSIRYPNALCNLLLMYISMKENFFLHPSSTPQSLWTSSTAHNLRYNKRVCKSIIGCQYQVSTATFPRQTVTKSSIRYKTWVCTLCNLLLMYISMKENFFLHPSSTPQSLWTSSTG